MHYQIILKFIYREWFHPLSHRKRYPRRNVVQEQAFLAWLYSRLGLTYCSNVRVWLYELDSPKRRIENELVFCKFVRTLLISTYYSDACSNNLTQQLALVVCDIK